MRQHGVWSSGSEQGCERVLLCGRRLPRVKDFYISLLRVTYGWSSFLMPNGKKELWQAAVYLTATYVFGVIFLIIGPLGEHIEQGMRGHVCAVVVVVLLVFNYRFAVKNSYAIRQEGRGFSAVASYLFILSLIAAGLAAIFFL